jgi:hypothetical protein
MPPFARHPLLTLAFAALAVVGCVRGEARSDGEAAARTSDGPVVITLGPTVELRDAASLVKPGGVVAGTVRRVPTGTWSLQWRDRGGALVRRRIQGGGDREFSFVVAYPRSVANDIALCRRAHDMTPEARATFYVGVPPATTTGFVRIAAPGANGVVDDASPAEAVTWRPWERADPPSSGDRALAVDLALETVGDPPLFERWRKEAAAGSPRARARVRVPCLSDPAHRAATEERIRVAFASPAACAASVVSLGTGLSPTYRGAPFDFCTSPHCTEAFRAFLREKYGTAEELARVWGRDVANWKDVSPPSLEECGFPTSGTYAAWIDHLAFRDRVFAAYLAAAVAQTRRLASNAAIGYWGASPGTVYGAADAPEVNEAVDWRGRFTGGVAPYLNELTTHRMAGSLRLGSRADDDGAHAFAAAVGGDLVQLFSSGESARACDILARGLGRLLQMAGPLPPRAVARTEPLRAEVALVHSRASVAASFLVDARASNLPWQLGRAYETRELDEEDSSYRRVWRAWCRLLRDCGVPYRVVSARDVARGELSSKGYRVAILVRAFSVADDEAAELERFARGGGVLVTDAGAGLYDGRLTLASPGSLADVFGIERTDVRFSEVGPRRVAIAHARFKREPADGVRDWFPRVMSIDVGPAERGLKLRGARAEGSFGDVPCLLVNGYEGGWGVTLNLALSSYLDVRPLPGGGRNLRMLIDGLMRRARVRPVVKMRLDEGAPARPEIELRALETGALAVVRREQRAGAPPVRARFLIESQGDGALYDAVRGEYRGRTNEIDVELSSGETRVYALLPYRLLSIHASPIGAPPDAERSGPERIEITMRRDGGSAWLTHVVEVVVTGPDGRARGDLGRIVEVAGGRAEIVIPFGEGDPRGLWTIRLRDTATGVVAVARLTRWDG